MSKDDAAAPGDAARASAPVADAEPPPDNPIVDLLHTIDCTVAVSSKVDNPRDYPEHLVDGKLETAWNGKTGDLHGWIALRIPKRASVARIELTAGFDKVGKDGDLFTMNHRIARVRISREGAVLKDATLDVDKRGLQAIDLDAPGGDFTIDVLETVPGTQKKWRELTVSELRVWGRTGGAPENPAHMPKMAIGSLDGVPPPPSLPLHHGPPPGPFDTTKALCAAYDKAMTPLIDLAFNDDHYPGALPGPHCADGGHTVGLPEDAFRHGPFLDVRMARIDTLQEQQWVLLVQTAKGWSRTNVVWTSRYHGDPGCMHTGDAIFEDVTFAKTSTGEDVAILRIVNRDIRWTQMDPRLDGAITTESAYACRVVSDGTVSCEGPKIAGTAHEPLPEQGDWSKITEAYRKVDVATIPWKTRKTPAIGPAGDLRLQ